jgi:hypothetical protein
MDFKSRMRKNAIPVTIGLLVLAIVLVLIAPEEKTLGSTIKIIYIHAAVVWVGLISFVLSGIFAALFFITGSDKTSKGEQLKSRMLFRSSGIQLTAIIFWTTSVIVGSIAAYITWGGNWWIEPRLKMAVYILAMAVVAYQVREIVKSDAVRAAVNLGLPVSVFFLLAITGKLVHPSNAFAQSESLLIKVFAALIAIVFAGIAINITPLFISKARERAKLNSDGRVEA